MRIFLVVMLVNIFCLIESAFAQGADIKLRQHLPNGKEHTIYWNGGTYKTATSLVSQLQILAQTEGTILNFISDPGDETVINVKIAKGDTLRFALDQLVRQDTRYRWWNRNGIVLVASRKLLEDADFILNLKIKNLDFVHKNRRQIVDAIQSWADSKYPGKYRVASGDNSDEPVLGCRVLKSKLNSADLSALNIVANGLTGIEVLNSISRQDNTY